jgi:predicted secreted protein
MYATLPAKQQFKPVQAAAFTAAHDSTTPVAYIVRPGALGVHDVGQWAGTGIITSYDPSGSVDGEWDAAITLQGSGDVTYTAPV